MKRHPCLPSSLLLCVVCCCVVCCGCLLLLAQPARAQTPSWLKNYRARMQLQWDKPAGERFSHSRGSLGLSRTLSQMEGRALDKRGSSSSVLGASLGAANDDGMALLMRKRVAEQRRRNSELMARQQQGPAGQLSRHSFITQRLGTRARGWADRYVSPWFVTGGFGATVRRATSDIHTRWEARLRRVNTPWPRLPLRRQQLPQQQRQRQPALRVF